MGLFAFENFENLPIGTISITYAKTLEWYTFVHYFISKLYEKTRKQCINKARKIRLEARKRKLRLAGSHISQPPLQQMELSIPLSSRHVGGANLYEILNCH